MKAVYFRSKFIEELAIVLGVEDSWRRIVIDIRYDGIATAYIERLIDEEKVGKINIGAGISIEEKTP